MEEKTWPNSEIFLQDVTVTNDGATILKLLEVEHPAAKVLCELADLQDQEVGDGTTSVVILAAEFLRGANELEDSSYLHHQWLQIGLQVSAQGFYVLLQIGDRCQPFCFLQGSGFLSVFPPFL